ncbi:hypothetical protein [Nocardioides sp. YIM 152315]|uniref:hypothetical protein n=1 Tax=Nocardioides sp. YIM 152315 TaxID=3031760 RepID=UPI0023DCAB93|nr:hypothetical protein [Nocardioides sp. YIM 152315]MDF1603411.1 hypothetical protein [Nocardioides sp. YIM 152315]
MFDREEAARRAEAATSNVPNTCQKWTREIFGVASVGDLDGDGAADAEDGWKSEPIRHRHFDRNPPRGVPVSYLGGSADNGHRAVSLGNGMIRSTDAGGRGRVATVPLDWPERAWGLTYAGWSETCDGVLVPLPPKPERKPEPKRRPRRIGNMIRVGRKAFANAKGHPVRRGKIRTALKSLLSIKKR